MLKRMSVLLLFIVSALFFSSCRNSSPGQLSFVLLGSSGAESWVLAQEYELFYIGEDMERLILDARVEIDKHKSALPVISIEILNNSNENKVEYAKTAWETENFKIVMPNVKEGDIYSVKIEAYNNAKKVAFGVTPDSSYEIMKEDSKDIYRAQMKNKT